MAASTWSIGVALGDGDADTTPRPNGARRRVAVGQQIPATNGSMEQRPLPRELPSAARLLSTRQAVVIDHDCLMRAGHAADPEALEMLAAWRDEGMHVVITSHDPSYSRQRLLSWLSSHGFVTTPDLLVPVARVTATIVAQRHPTSTVLVVGPPALEAEVDKHRLERTPDARAADVVVVAGAAPFQRAQPSSAIEAVMAGAALYATSREATVSTPDGLAPGTDALLSSVEAATKRQAVVVGRPSAAILDEACRAAGTRDLVVICASDVAAASAAAAALPAVVVGPRLGGRLPTGAFAVERLDDVALAACG